MFALCIFILICDVIYSVQGKNPLPLENFTESIDGDRVSGATWSEVIAPMQEHGASTSTSNQSESEEQISIGMVRRHTIR